MPTPALPEDVSALIAELHERNAALGARIAALEATAIAVQPSAPAKRARGWIGSPLVPGISGAFILAIVAAITAWESTRPHMSPSYPWPQVCLGLLGFTELLRAAEGWEWRLIRGLLPAASIVAAILWFRST